MKEHIPTAELIIIEGEGHAIRSETSVRITKT
jgi:hypothetical protein